MVNCTDWSHPNGKPRADLTAMKYKDDRDWPWYEGLKASIPGIAEWIYMSHEEKTIQLNVWVCFTNLSLVFLCLFSLFQHAALYHLTCAARLSGPEYILPAESRDMYEVPEHPSGRTKRTKGKGKKKAPADADTLRPRIFTETRTRLDDDWQGEIMEEKEFHQLLRQDGGMEHLSRQYNVIIYGLCGDLADELGDMELYNLRERLKRLERLVPIWPSIDESWYYHDKIAMEGVLDQIATEMGTSRPPWSTDRPPDNELKNFVAKR